MPSSSRPEYAEQADVADFAKRYETLGNRDEAVQTSTGTQRRRTIEDCVRETEEQRLLGIEVICRPTWEDMEQAHDEAGAQITAG